MEINENMLSIIICSRSSQLPDALVQNIAETVGVDYELLVIDNSSSTYSIFSAYNEGVMRSRGNVICFMHEDIMFYSKDWGRKAIDRFRDENIGVVGVVGSNYMPQCPAGWWMTSTIGHEQKEVFENGNVKKSLVEYSKQVTSEEFAVVVDGFWFCMPRRVFELVKFDDVRFDGFHCYDNDICMQVINCGYKIVVARDILIEHKSEGVLNKQWVINVNVWYNKWKKYLPMNVVDDFTVINEKAVIAHCCNKYSILLFANRMYGLAFRYYLKSIFYYPYKISRYKIFIADYIMQKKTKK